MTKKLSNGWRMTEEYPVSKWAPSYLKEMVEETLQDGRPPPREVPASFKGKLVADLTGEEREEFLFSMQAKSTQDALERQKTRAPEDDLEYVLRPIPEDYLAVKDATCQDDLTAMRSMTPEEYSHAESVRSRQKHTRGESKLSSLTPAGREKAVHAFMYSEPADPSVGDLKRLQRFVEIDAVSPEKAEKPKLTLVAKEHWWQRILRFFDVGPGHNGS